MTSHATHLPSFIVNFKIGKLSITKTIATWLQRNRTRKQLAQLPDHILKDIGLTRIDVLQESQKAFWQQ